MSATVRIVPALTCFPGAPAVTGAGEAPREFHMLAAARRRYGVIYAGMALVLA